MGGIILHRIRGIDYIALTLVILGAINWGLLGFFRFDLVGLFLGGIDSAISRIVYGLIGLSAIYCLTFYAKLDAADSRDYASAEDSNNDV
jgi:uncharacterized membrane protein YuzA (DUF378 family)